MRKGKGLIIWGKYFPNVSEAKTKDGIFVGPQVTKIFEDQDISTKFNSTDGRGWKAFENVCRNFTGNKTAESYSEIVQELISSHSPMGCNMSLKLQFLQSHLDFVPGSFLQDISQTENSSSGKWSPNMLADYCRGILIIKPTRCTNFSNLFLE